MATHSILLIDPDRQFSMNLAAALSAEGLTVYGPCPAPSQVTRIEPDLVVIDPAAHGMSEQEGMLTTLRQNFPDTPVMVLSSDMSDSALRESLSVGVVAHIGKEMALAGVLHAIRLALLGQAIFPDRAFALMAQLPVTTSTSHDLSPRETQILACLLQSPSNRAIAERLNISESTVKMHFKNLLRKLGAANRTQAAVWAMEQGITPAP